MAKNKYPVTDEPNYPVEPNTPAYTRTDLDSVGEGRETPVAPRPEPPHSESTNPPVGVVSSSATIPGVPPATVAPVNPQHRSVLDAKQPAAVGTPEVSPSAGTHTLGDPNRPGAGVNERGSSGTATSAGSVSSSATLPGAPVSSTPAVGSGSSSAPLPGSAVGPSVGSSSGSSSATRPGSAPSFSAETMGHPGAASTPDMRVPTGDPQASARTPFVFSGNNAPMSAGGLRNGLNTGVSPLGNSILLDKSWNYSRDIDLFGGEFHSRTLNIDGVTYEHVDTDAEGRWRYAATV